LSISSGTFSRSFHQISNKEMKIRKDEMEEEAQEEAEAAAAAAAAALQIPSPIPQALRRRRW